MLGLLLLVAEKVSRRERAIETITRRDAIVIGFAQALALIPGVSRSGATITAGLFLGFDRVAAARFSFLLSVPAVVLSGLFELRGVDRRQRRGRAWASRPTAVATLLAFVSGYASIAFLLKFLTTHTTAVFVAYRVVLGVVGARARGHAHDRLAAGRRAGPAKVFRDVESRRSDMASVDTTAAQSTNGHGTGAEIPVENPATGEVIAHVADLGRGKVAELARLGRAAQPGWQALGFDGRARVHAPPAQVAHGQRRRRRRDARLGDRQDLRGREPHRAALHRRRADATGPSTPSASSPTSRVRVRTLAVTGKKMVTRYEPLGLVGIIGPWNYPLVNSFGDAIPALLAGNSVILKPSEFTPLTSLLARRARSRECGMPANVFQVATGRGATGAALVDEADFVMFTGSTATGKKVLARAAQTLTPVSLELGGKDPMIVLVRRRPRARGQRRRLLLDAQRRPDLHLRRARLRRGAGVRRLRRSASSRRSTRSARARRPGPATSEVGAMTTARAARDRRAPRRRRGRQGRARADGRQARRGRRARSTSRRSSSTSTTRCRR